MGNFSNKQMNQRFIFLGVSWQPKYTNFLYKSFILTFILFLLLLPILLLCLLIVTIIIITAIIVVTYHYYHWYHYYYWYFAFIFTFTFYSIPYLPFLKKLFIWKFYIRNCTTQIRYFYFIQEQQQTIVLDGTNFKNFKNRKVLISVPFLSAILFSKE